MGKSGAKWVTKRLFGATDSWLTPDKLGIFHHTKTSQHLKLCAGAAMFQGKFEHSVDDKGRLAIPAPFRKKLNADGREEDVTVYVTISDQCLAVYTSSEWSAKMGQIAKLNQFDPKVMAFKRIFVGCAQECPVDRAGRILLPADLRRDMKIGRDCVVVGQIEKFEIWASERWADSYNQLSDQVSSVYASLADLGIQI